MNQIDQKERLNRYIREIDIKFEREHKKPQNILMTFVDPKKKN